jgi:hypothetical protein
MRSFIIIVVLLAAVAPPASAAGPAVVSTSPAANSMVPISAGISVSFDVLIDSATVDSASFRVFGDRSGPIQGTRAATGFEISFTPQDHFHVGEQVTVTLSHDIQAEDGMPLRSAGYSFQFLTGTGAAQMNFAPIDTMSNVTCCQTRIYGAGCTDLDEDGYLDLITVNEVSGDIRVTLNKGDGTGLYHPFLPPQAVGEEVSPNRTADFDNDGHSDFCVASTSDGSVFVLLGDGDGVFGSTQEITVGVAPHGLVVLDVDGDGDTDIVNANRSSNLLSMMLNDGNGAFGAATFFDGGVSGEYGLDSGDMNRDGILDLVVASNVGEIRTLLGNGDGTFSAATAASTGGATWVVVLGDLNGDGDLDATTANSFHGTGSILMGNGDGTFTFSTTENVGGHLVSTDLGDLDGDGDLDWVLSSFGANRWRILTNDGSGVFSFKEDILAPANPSCSILYDFDNDRDLDMALSDEIADVLILMENQGEPVGVPDLGGSGGRLPPNVPNPFTQSTVIRFGLESPQDVELRVYDVHGRLVHEHDWPGLPAGDHEFGFTARGRDGRPLPSGVYLYTVRAEGEVRSGRMHLVR